MRYYLGPWVLGSYPGFPLSSFWRMPVGSVGCIDLRSITEHATAGNGFFTTPDAVTLGTEYLEIARGQIDTFVMSATRREALATRLGLLSISGATLLDCLVDILTVRAHPSGALRWRPLMPTSAGKLEIYLGGHSLIWEKQFNLSDVEAANVRAVIQEDYRRIRQAALDGLTPDPLIYRKVLGALGRKYRVPDPENYFIPPDLPKERILTPSTTITDNFNRANGELGTSAEGWSWVDQTGDLDIVSNQTSNTAVGTGDFWVSRAETDLSSDDHYSQTTVVQPGAAGAAHGGAAARMASAADTYYRVIMYAGDDNVYISKVVSATETHLNNAAVTPSIPEVYKLEVNGSSIKGFQVATERVAATDTAITGNLRCGIAGWRPISTTAVNLDNFEAADLAAGVLPSDPIDPAILI